LKGSLILILEHLRWQGAQVIHQDIKHADGVDLAGDLVDQRFLEEIVKIQPQLIPCNNLLEHLENRELSNIDGNHRSFRYYTEKVAMMARMLK
jgi:hypothetical protein